MAQPFDERCVHGAFLTRDFRYDRQATAALSRGLTVRGI
jgi:hypothetical protein